jgi:hypothetical protein
MSLDHQNGIGTFRRTFLQAFYILQVKVWTRQMSCEWQQCAISSREVRNWINILLKHLAQWWDPYSPRTLVDTYENWKIPQQRETYLPIYLQPFVWPWPLFSVSWSNTQSVGLLGRGISPSQCLHLYIEQHKHRIITHNTDIYALSGIRTHESSDSASEDSSCLRPRGRCDRQRET